MSVFVYVDDEEMLGRVFNRVIRSLNVTVKTFTDPAAALEFIEANEVTVVICDYLMPKLDGLQVLARITRDVPFILVSGDIISDVTAANPRITRVLAKPFRPEELLAVLRPYATPPAPTAP